MFRFIELFPINITGAKPPKKPYLNYKELMRKRKADKLKEETEKQNMISKIVMQKTGKKKKKGVNNDVGHFLSGYGKVISINIINAKVTLVYLYTWDFGKAFFHFRSYRCQTAECS